MSLPFINPSQAKTISDSIKLKSSISTAQAVDQIKNTENKQELISIIKNIGSPISSIKRENIKPPNNYKPLTFEQRKDWNKYLDYLESIGLQGSPTLDKGTPTKGRVEFSKYLKENPNSSLNDFKDHDVLVKNIQYEMRVLRKGIDGSPFDLSSDELKALQEFLFKTRNKFMTTKTSDSDGNPGQYTTMEYYPSFAGGSSFDYKKYIDSIGNTLK